MISEAVAAANKSDVVVAVVGEAADMTGNPPACPISIFPRARKNC
jgi:hypothetical protein